MAKTVYTHQGIEKLAEIIRAARGHLSGRAFAKKVGLSPTPIDRILKNYSNPGLSNYISKVAIFRK
jgi:DNA-binding phage protein